MLRLGLDIGTNSIGWWLYQIADGRPTGVIDGGVQPQLWRRSAVREGILAVQKPGSSRNWNGNAPTRPTILAVQKPGSSRNTA